MNQPVILKFRNADSFSKYTITDIVYNHGVRTYFMLITARNITFTQQMHPYLNIDQNG